MPLGTKIMFLFQLLFTVFALLAIASVVKKKKDGRFGAKSMIFLVLFWVLAIVAVLWPDSTTILANRFGIGRGTDFVLYISVAVIFYLIFKLHIKIESLNRDVTKIVRKESLDEKAKNN